MAGIWRGGTGLGLRAFGDARSPGCAGPSHHLLLGDSRLLLAVPLAVMQTHSIPVKQIQVVDSHLQGTRYGPRSRSAHTQRAPVFRPRSLQPGGFLPWTHRNCSECPSQGTSCFLRAPLLPVLGLQLQSNNSTEYISQPIRGRRRRARAHRLPGSRSYEWL